MAYDPNVETEKSLKALEKQIYKEYSRAYEEMSKTADQYFRTLEDRYKIEYEAYQRGAYTKQEFDLWYKTQIERGQGYNHMRDQLAGRMVEANKVASAYINDKTPSIYSLNYNHEAYRIEGAHPSARFDIYDEQTVKRLIEGGNAVEFKTVNPNPVRDYNWNKDQITSALTSGILQGKPIDKIADSFLTVMERNRTSAMRNARTAYTSAQNAGRQESYRSAKRMGITMMKEWLATTDERTRASHGAMDGERVETDQTFSNELMYPADPDGAPEEVYNCRCTMFAVLPDINDEKRETYSDWIKRKEAEMSDKEAKSEKEKELKKAIERWNASHYSQPSTKPAPEPQIQFEPAKTKAEAEAYALQFASSVDYNGVSLENANKINETLTHLNAKYTTNKLDEIYQKRSKAVASSNWHRLGINGQKIGKSFKQNFVNKQNETRDTIELLKKRFEGKTMPSAIKDNIIKLENSLKFKRWGVMDSYPDKDLTKWTITHEYGHIIADQYFGQLNHERANPNISTNWSIKSVADNWRNVYLQAHSNGDIYMISEYASQNEKEFFAECFCAREAGEKLPDYIDKAIGDILKNGIL